VTTPVPALMGRRVAMFVLNDMRLDSRVRREAGTLAANGYDVTVYAVMSDATSHLQWEEVDGYTIVRVPMLMRPATEALATSDAGHRGRRIGRAALVSAFVATRPLLGGALHFAANWQLRWRPWARRVMAQVMPADVWHAHDFNTLGLAVACAERFGGRLVYDSHEVFTEAGATSALPGGVRAVLRRMQRGWASRADAVITVNGSVAEVLREQLGVPHVGVIHNFANPPAGGASPLRERIGVRADADVILYHGSVTTGRGIETLIASFDDRRLDGAHLVIMGYGPLRPRIQALAGASEASDRIHFLPPVPPSEVTTWVAGADVAVMPIEPTTLNHRLSSPNKLFEAIAAGVPVVGPDFAEFRRVVYASGWGPLGRLHVHHSPTAIATAMHELLVQPAPERAALRARCRAAADGRWNWEAEARRLLNTYAALPSLPLYAGGERPAFRRGSIVPARHDAD
jgi:glycosyltransferase involved in cell wall biosynthesis